MSAGNKRIAKNTLALYFRTILTLGVSLYTSRIVLNALGASDFGLYSLVGSLMGFLGLLNTAMSSSTQRFLNFEQGTTDRGKLSRVFGTSLYIHLMLAGVILLVAETVGLWVLNTHLNIAPERMGAANWVYQSAVASFLLWTIVVPYTATIVANEKMTAFAYIALLDVALKLLAAFLLQIIGTDKLKLYAALTLIASLVSALTYLVYARYHFQESRGRPRKDPQLFRQMLSFSGWTITSHLSVIMRVQGVNILLNLFFGTVINAAMGIATQVNMAVRGFASNFTQALNPQIVKNYAGGDLGQMHTLVLTGCRLSFFLVLLFSLPVVIETDAILHLWLKNVPDHTAMFVRLILVQTLVESFASVMAAAQGATGRVKYYHITLSAIGLMNLPISYFLLKAGLPPYITLVVAIVFSAIISLSRALFLRKSIGLSLRAFLGNVLARCGAIALLAPALPLILRHYMAENLLNSFIIAMTSCLSVVVVAAMFGLTGDERRFILRKLARKLKISGKNLPQETAS